MEDGRVVRWPATAVAVTPEGLIHDAVILSNQIAGVAEIGGKRFPPTDLT
jgi:hypothetical protein